MMMSVMRLAVMMMVMMVIVVMIDKSGGRSGTVENEGSSGAGESDDAGGHMVQVRMKILMAVRD